MSRTQGASIVVSVATCTGGFSWLDPRRQVDGVLRAEGHEAAERHGRRQAILASTCVLTFVIGLVNDPTSEFFWSCATLSVVMTIGNWWAYRWIVTLRREP